MGVSRVVRTAVREEPASPMQAVEQPLAPALTLSPCVWTALERERGRNVVKELAEAPASQQDSGEAPVAPPPPLCELLLSPASQLNVLSQISELADAQSRQDAPRRPHVQTHVWAPSKEKVKRKGDTQPSNNKPKAKRQKTTKQKQPAASQTKRLAADMLDWETCSEGGLFNSEEEDQWVYEDISDSDFDA